MTDSTTRAIREQEAKIVALEARVKALSDTISRATSEIAAIKPKIEIEASRLAGMKEIVRLLNSKVDDVTPTWDADEVGNPHQTIDAGDKPRRRMRLGTKKRVVFQMIASGVTSPTAISEAVQWTDIDPRFLRDCFRSAALDGEIIGGAEGYALTELGAELLEKAPISKDWDQYASLFNPKEAHSLF